MKTNRLISIALVAIMALTVVSGAGVITAQAATPPVLSPMVVTQDGTAVDPTALQVGKEAIVQWTYTWQDPAPVQQGSAYIQFTQVSIPDGSTAWPVKSATVIDQNNNNWFDVGDGYAMRLTFTPDKEGTYVYHVTLHAQIVEFEQTLDTDISLVARLPEPTNFVKINNLDGVAGQPYTYNGIPFGVYHAGLDYAVLSTKDQLTLRSVDLSSYGHITRVHMLQTAGDSQTYPDNYVAGTVVVYYMDGTTSPLDLKLGRNTAEWAYDRPGMTVAHTKITPAYSFETTMGSTTPYNGHYFYASIETGGKRIDHIGISAPQDPPNAHVFALTLETADATRDTVLQDLAKLRSDVNSLPNAAFLPGTKWMLLNAINVATWQVNNGKYADAANTLTWVLARMDGYHNNGAHPDWNDWVRTSAAQGQLYPQVAGLIADLQVLQGAG